MFFWQRNRTSIKQKRRTCSATEHDLKNPVEIEHMKRTLFPGFILEMTAFQTLAWGWAEAFIHVTRGGSIKKGCLLARPQRGCSFGGLHLQKFLQKRELSTYLCVKKDHSAFSRIVSYCKVLQLGFLFSPGCRWLFSSRRRTPPARGSLCTWRCTRRRLRRCRIPRRCNSERTPGDPRRAP